MLLQRVVFHNVREFHYNVHQSTTYRKKEYDKEQHYTIILHSCYTWIRNGYMERIFYRHMYCVIFSRNLNRILLFWSDDAILISGPLSFLPRPFIWSPVLHSPPFYLVPCRSSRAPPYNDLLSVHYNKMLNKYTSNM